MTQVLEIADDQLDLADLVFGTASTAISQRVRLNSTAKRAKRPQVRGLAEWSRRYLAHYFKLPANAMHRWSFEQCDASRDHRGMKINLIGPRGNAKSTVFSLAHVLRCAVEAIEPLIWLVSETADQADPMLENVKLELTENEQLAADYPEACGRGATWRKSKIRLRNGVTIEAFGKGRKIRGRRARADRPSLIVCDDLQGEMAMISSGQRTKDTTWFNGALLKTGNPHTNVVNLATALHRDAVALKLDRTPGWTSRVFSSISKWPDNMGLWAQWADIYSNVSDPDSRAKSDQFFADHREEMLKGAEILWPELEDLLALMRQRVEEGRNEFEREKQGRPVLSDQCEFPEEYFDDHIWFEEWPDRFSIRTMALDPSKGKDARRGDYSAFAMVQVTDGVFYVDMDLARRPVQQIITDGVALHGRFNPQGFSIESNQFQELLGADFADEFRRQGLPHVQPYLIDNRVSKLVRIRTLDPVLSAHRIRFRVGSPGVLLTIGQLRDFPDKDSHDDGPDALEMAIRTAAELLSGAGQETEEVIAGHIS